MRTYFYVMQYSLPLFFGGRSGSVVYTRANTKNLCALGLQSYSWCSQWNLMHSRWCDRNIAEQLQCYFFSMANLTIGIAPWDHSPLGIARSHFPQEMQPSFASETKCLVKRAHKRGQLQCVTGYQLVRSKRVLTEYSPVCCLVTACSLRRTSTEKFHSFERRRAYFWRGFISVYIVCRKSNERIPRKSAGTGLSQVRRLIPIYIRCILLSSL